MHWAACGLYGCGLILYLATRYYYENEFKNANIDRDFDVCFRRGQYIKEEISDKSNITRSLLHMQDGRQTSRLANHIVHEQAERYRPTRIQRTIG
ncbi:unnamed protein product [Danaus chrysippus]|uniref:(African queen) hypothetical protein n=1 Tax=Danaus chrysippus TaxID=151541 RepID=A0A8J2QD54_9NEOP|nr:unnamed protein product [Danaus chrysippus]